MSENLRMGEIIRTEQNRDAVHIAVAPVVSAQRLQPGEWVGIDLDGNASTSAKSVGVVDPFLRVEVDKGQKFWLFLIPGSITSLRHDWIHPAFSEEERSACDSREYLQEWANRLGVTFDEFIAGAARGGHMGTDIDYYGEIPDDLWLHYERFTGKAPPSNRSDYFHCSC